MVKFLALAGMATSRSGGGNGAQRPFDNQDQKSHLQLGDQPRPPARQYGDNTNNSDGKLSHSPPPVTTTTMSRKGKRRSTMKGDDDDDDDYKADPTRPQYHLPQQVPGSPTMSVRTEDRDYMMMQGHDAPPSYEDSMAAHQRSNNNTTNASRNSYAPPSRAEEAQQESDAAPSLPPLRFSADRLQPPSPQMATTHLTVDRSVSPVSPLSALPPPSLSTQQQQQQQQQQQPGLRSMPSLQAVSPLVPSPITDEPRSRSPLRMHPVSMESLPRVEPARQSTVPLLRRPVPPPRQVSGPSHNHRRPDGERGSPRSSRPPVLAPSLTASPRPVSRPKTSSSSTSFQQWTAKLNSTAAMDKECVKARKILQSFLGGAEDPKPTTNRSSSKSPVQIPDAVLQQAHGLVIYTVIRAGFNLSGSRGSGVVLARLPSPTDAATGLAADSNNNSSRCSIASSVTSWGSFRRWTGPSAFSVYGAGATLLGGFDVSESVCVLNSAEAVRAFYGGSTSRGGAELGGYQRNSGKNGGLAVAAGPTTESGLDSGGMPAELRESTLPAAPPPMWIYTKTRGLYIGGSVDGTVFSEKRDVNEAFYDEPGITPDRILTGNVRPEFKGRPGQCSGESRF
ncbi:hypothetical protein PG994_000996 [Apiospora phragmitis]|uniref:Ysc84 actin-binding domain-containing protein n=1 Tax=Apiospora phragmitis TaxID=2905665 RepID=A0ABR1WRA9_9PEZI